MNATETATSAPIIQVAGLTKHYQVHQREAGLWAALRSLVRRRYQTKEAVSDVSFSIGVGERVGFLGPNGAGKTTTLKMLSGLLHPTSGQVLVAGHVPQRRQTRFLQQITLVMGQKQQLLWDLPPVDTFALNRAVYDVPAAQFDETLAELVQLLEIEGVMRTPTRQLSLGERMKCELCAALLHRPKVLFLDEPTIGLDIAMQETLRRFVRAYNERFQATILLTSHYMDDVMALCQRIIVIDKGRLRYDGDLQTLVATLRPDKRVSMRLSADADVAVVSALLARVGTPVSQGPGQAVVQIPKESLREAVGHLLDQLPVVDLTIEDPPLEEVLRDLLAAPLPGAAPSTGAAP